MRKAAYLCIIIVTVLAALIYGQSLIIPFIIAFLLWFLTIEIRTLLNRFSFFKKYVPDGLKNIVVFLLMTFVLVEVVQTLISNISELTASYSTYESNLKQVLKSVQSATNIDIEKNINNFTENLDIGGMLSTLVNGLSGFLGNATMILVYALFIFLEEVSIKDKIKKVFDTETGYNRFLQTITRIEKSVFDYLRLKTVVSLLTGALSYFVLLFVGIDSPMFWAFLIFLLNYIPTIGSLVATVFPAIFSLVQFGTLTPFLVILIVVGTIQLIVGNVVEPRLMGKSLNISPLVTIIALAVWGKIWGIIGMVLSVPIMVVLIIVLSQFDKTKKLAILLTENGELD